MLSKKKTSTSKAKTPVKKKVTKTVAKSPAVKAHKKVIAAKKKTEQKKKLLFSAPTDETLFPLMAASSSDAGATRGRRNAVAFNQVKDRYPNLNDGLVPFQSSKSKSGNPTINIKDTIELTQKAYYNFSLFKNTIDLMTEFSINKIFFRGGTKKSKAFFEALFDAGMLWSLQDRFFREYFRSGNVFIYRFDANVGVNSVKKLNSILKTSANQLVIPAKYIILNPADMEAGGDLSFDDATYSKALNAYELEILKNPRSEKDKLFFEALPEALKEGLKKKDRGGVSKALNISIPLSKEKVTIIFSKKQDYEPFAVPMGFPVLDDIEFKIEMKKLDSATMRHMQQAILLITMGTETKDGKLYIDQKQKKAMQTLFQNQSVGKVLIADFTTKAEFIIPDIADILNPRKYEIVDKDIKEGLNTILTGGDKFANQSGKVDIFIERLKQARESFILEFLIPEMERIADQLNLKNIPTPKFANGDFKDKLQFAKIQTRLMELGLLTPDEGFEAMDTGMLPDRETSLENQEEYKKERDKGFYAPVVGGSNQGETGRPEGSTGTPQSTKKVTPAGDSAVASMFSLSKVKNNMILASSLDSEIKEKLKEKFQIKRLTKSQKGVIDEIAHLIVVNEKPKVWKKNIDKYLKNPVNYNEERVLAVDEIAAEHGIDTYLAGILLSSEKDED